jgi:hypothetical protein
MERPNRISRFGKGLRPGEGAGGDKQRFHTMCIRANAVRHLATIRRTGPERADQRAAPTAVGNQRTVD